MTASDGPTGDSTGIDFAEVAARAGNLRWRVLRSGPEGGPSLLLLHGFTGKAEGWDGIARRLPLRRCWIPDLPGHGGTAPPLPADEWRMPRLADALDELLESLGAGSTDVAGYSMGGRAALQLAVRRPGRVRRLILIGATAGIDSAEERNERAASDLDLAGALEAEGIAQFVDRWEALPLFATQRSLPASTRERLREQRLSHDPLALAASLRAFGTGFQEPLHGLLSAIASPTLLIAGGRDAKFRRIAEAMQARIPGARMEILAGAGHAVHLERPDELAALMEAFLSPLGAREGREP